MNRMLSAGAPTRGVASLVVRHESTGLTYELGEAGIDRSTVRTMVALASAPDISIRRTRAADGGDFDSSWSAGALADATTISVRGAPPVRVWGVPAEVPVDVPTGRTATLRFHASHSPFAVRPLVFDLHLERGVLRSRSATGHADLEVEGDFAAIAAWLVLPGLVVRDDVPFVRCGRGDAAVLRRFVEVLRSASSAVPPEPAPLLHWAQLWPSGPTRRVLQHWAAVHRHLR